MSVCFWKITFRALQHILIDNVVKLSIQETWIPYIFPTQLLLLQRYLNSLDEHFEIPIPASWGALHSPEEKDTGEDDNGTGWHQGSRTSDLQWLSSKCSKVPCGTPLRRSLSIGCSDPCLVLSWTGEVREEMFARPVIGPNLQIGVTFTICIHWVPPRKEFV